jgi:hypothetical protein
MIIGRYQNVASYQDRLRLYEQLKREIARTAKSPEEYDRRIKALAKKLNI